MIFNLTQPLISSVPVLGKDFTWSGSDGTCLVIDDGGGNWRIKFLSSGVFTPLKTMTIDVFVVGAGGGGHGKYSAGGGGGYTKTAKSVVLEANTQYSIEIGASGADVNGGNTSAFGSTSEGGKVGGTSFNGGDGGSGGGSLKATGGVDGADGNSSSPYTGGKGQGTTTREFGESTGDLYSSGGDGISDGAAAGADNTGDGGDYGKAGGSGIVVIRKHKEAVA